MSKVKWEQKHVGALIRSKEYGKVGVVVHVYDDGLLLNVGYQDGQYASRMNADWFEVVRDANDFCTGDWVVWEDPVSGHTKYGVVIEAPEETTITVSPLNRTIEREWVQGHAAMNRAITRLNEHDRHQEQIAQDARVMEAFKDQVREVAIRVADEEGWCDSGLNEVLEELGLEGKTSEGTLTLTVRVKVKVKSLGEFDASDVTIDSVYLDELDDVEMEIQEFDVASYDYEED